MKRVIHGFWRKHPLFVSALVAVAGIAAWQAGNVVFCAVVAAFMGIGWWLGKWRWLAGAAFPVLAAGVLFGIREHRKQEETRLLLDALGGNARGVLCADARGGGKQWEAVVKLKSGQVPGAKVWWRGVGQAPVAGTVVEAWGKYEALPRARNEGAFDKAEWLRNQGVVAVFETGWNRTSQDIGWRARVSSKLRHGFRDAVTDGLDHASSAAQIIRAVVVGEMPKDADVLVDAFRRSGSLHVFSVSGLHVVLMVGAGWFFLKWCGVSRRVAIPFLLVLAVGYAWITGNSAPAVRAAWMTTVFLGAFVFRRRPDLLNALGAVLLVAVLVDGRVLFQPGVQLSYGVVAAIGMGVNFTARFFRWMGNPELYLPVELMNKRQRVWLWLRRWLASTLGVSTAAAAGSAPLTAWHFGMVTPVSIPASVVLVPLVGGMLSVGLVSAAVHVISPSASRWINRGNAWLARGAEISARFFADIPGGHFQTRVERFPALRIYDLSYGAGAACFAGNGTGVLLDCGGRESFRYEVLPSLRKLGIMPDSVVLSHPDGRHLGGGMQVWEALPIKQAVLPVESARSPAFREWSNLAPAAGVRLVQAGNVPFLALPDDASLELLHAPEAGNLHLIADKRVAVYRLHWRGMRILFTSDAGYDTEMAMLRSGKDLRADVIVAGRSHEGLSLTGDFLDAVGPALIIAGNSPHPPEERLPETAAEYWKSRGMTVMDQRITGGVTIRPAGKGLECVGFLDGSRFLLMPSGSGAGASVFPLPPTGSENPSLDKKTHPLPKAAR